MTMGALHDGHVALIRAARDRVGSDGAITVTIFVNPLQFGAGEDLERYPRTLDTDLDICRAEGVDVVFAPDRDDMYPDGRPQVTVDPGPLAGELEGLSRPTHFAGVLTVVAKLLNLTVPTYALFGEKDYQQLVLVRRMGWPCPAATASSAVTSVRPLWPSRVPCSPASTQRPGEGGPCSRLAERCSRPRMESTSTTSSCVTQSWARHR
jgi:pantothenate synthetase